MQKQERRSLAIFPILVLFGLSMAWAGSQGGVTVAGVPLYLAAVGLIFVIQWLAFVPAYRQQSEKFFDLTGSLTYITIMLLTLTLNPLRDARSYLVAILVIIWAVRLGSFLYRRVRQAGKDGRFDELKPYFWTFLNVWTLQALWVTFTAAAGLAVLTTANRQALGPFALIGLLLWGIGITIEVIADIQKSRFRANPANKEQFIQTGLWRYSRHPNYLGEIILWVGICIIALPILQGWQWVALISPVFVTLLLTRVSGIPLLEQRADTRWGGQEAYEAYKARTPALVPRFYT
ncbi:MAG: DUF1295 domain-containing protein [Chloroflexota bacterium]